LPNPFSPDHQGVDEPKPAVLAWYMKGFNGNLFSIGSTGSDGSVEVCPPTPELGSEVMNRYRLGSEVRRELGFRPDTDYIQALTERFGL
jgi:hypothetical protein